MKKLSVILLSLAILASMLTGCTGTEPAETNVETKAETQVETTAAKAAETTAEVKETEAETAPAAPSWQEEHPSWLCEEKTTLKVVTYDGASSSYPPPTNDLPFWQYMEELTNVHIDWDVIPITGYDEIIKTRIAAGNELGDIINVRGYDTAYAAATNGIFADLAPYWDDCFNYVDEYFDAKGVNYRGMQTNQDGHAFVVTGTVEPVEGHVMLCYNTLWLKELGAEVPETLDEFTDLVYRMKEAGDLNGNGEADEVILTSTNLNVLGTALNPAFNLYGFSDWDQFAVNDGNVFPEYTADNEKEYLSYLSKLFADGILDAEICNMSTDMLSSKAAADRVGIFAFHGNYATTYGNLTTAGQSDKNGEYFTLGKPLASEYNGNHPYFILRDQASTDATCINAQSENIELACRWLDSLMAHPDALMTRTNGFEGQNYTKNADGTISLIYPEDGSAWSVKELGCGQITLPHIQTKDQILNSKLKIEWYINEYADLRDNYEWRHPAITQVNVFTNEEQEKLDEVKIDCRDYYNEMRAKFITGSSDIEKEWDTYVQNMDKLGLETWTEAWQSVYDRTK